MNNTQQLQYIQEDEIDLRELFDTIMRRKKFIMVFTFIVTVLAIIYSLTKTPIYEARALVEIGSYKLHNNNNNNNNKAYLDNGSQLVQKLNLLFIDRYKNKKDLKAKIVSISIPKKGAKTFIEIKSEAISNELAKKEITKVISFIKEQHQKILDDVKQRREMEIGNIEKNIESIKTKAVPLLDKKIALQEQSLKEFKDQVESIRKNISKIEDKNPALTALKLMEKRDLTTFIINLNTQLMDMRDKRDEILNRRVAQLEEQKTLLKSLLLPHNYKNSEVIGEILTNDYPIKPKKKLIVIVAFVTGLILSIFLVFFLEFINGNKEDKREAN